jgi:hypothetical protein
MSEIYGLKRWLPQLITVFNERNEEIPLQLQEAEKKLAKSSGEGGWFEPEGMKSVLLWEQQLITDIEHLIYHAQIDITCPAVNFGKELKDLLGPIDYDIFHEHHHHMCVESE